MDTVLREKITDFVATVDARNSLALIAELEYILSDLGLSEKVRIIS